MENRVDQDNGSGDSALTHSSNPVAVNGNEVVDEELLRQCAEEFIKTHPDLAGLTPEEVLEDDECRKRIEDKVANEVAKAKEAAEKDAKRAKDEAKAKFNAKMAAARAALEGERKLKPEEIQSQLSSSAMAAVSQPKKQETAGSKSIMDLMAQAPEAVLELKKVQGSALLACVYRSANEAVLFRSKLISCAKKYHEALRAPKLDPAYGSVLRGVSQLIQPLIDKTAEVISAWGLDPKVARVKDPDTFFRIGREMANDTRFSGMVKLITPEDIKAAEDVKVAEQKEEADRATTRDVIAVKLLQVGFDASAATRLARKILKKSFDECDGDINKMLRAAAIGKMTDAGSDEDQRTALLFAKAAGISPEELKAEVDLQKRRQEAVGILLYKDGCEETAATRAARADAKKSNQKNGAKKGKKGKGK